MLYLCIHWLILVPAMTGGQTHNFGISGRHSNQLSYPARASSPALDDTFKNTFQPPLHAWYWQQAGLPWHVPGVCLGIGVTPADWAEGEVSATEFKLRFSPSLLNRLSLTQEMVIVLGHSYRLGLQMYLYF